MSKVLYRIENTHTKEGFFRTDHYQLPEGMEKAFERFNELREVGGNTTHEIPQDEAATTDSPCRNAGDMLYNSSREAVWCS